MASYNKVILIGNLTRDPELRFTPKGTAVAKLGLAVNRTWKTETGEQREEVAFIDIDAFGRQAEVIGQYLKKGRQLMVEGRLRYETWDDKQTGQKRSKLGVVLEAFQFLDSGQRSNEGGAPVEQQQQQQVRRPAPANEPPPPQDEPPPHDDDVPF
jgi:single-strand DNA-binding protein